MIHERNTIQIRCPVCRQMDVYPIGAQNLRCSVCGTDLNSPNQRPAKGIFPEPPPIRRPNPAEYAPRQTNERAPSDGRGTGRLLKKILTNVKESRERVTIFTTNGVQLHGRVTGFDEECLTLDSDGNTPVIMRRAISTIFPGNVLKTQEWKGE